MKILIIGATHGNELLGTRFYQYLLRKRSHALEHIDFIIGNPRAYIAKKRYTEQDLNRSYGTSDSSYESLRASEIKQYIAATKPGLVLDMHTTTCQQPTCLIVNNLNGVMKRQLLRASHIEHILQVQPMNDIFTVRDDAVGYEVSNQSISLDLLRKIEADLIMLIAGQSSDTAKKLYKMSGKIYKKEVVADQAKTFVNFEVHPLGFVPVLTGENSYKEQTDYLGFKASPPEEITL